MAKNKVLTEKTDINTPFSEFVRKFKKQKTVPIRFKGNRLSSWFRFYGWFTFPDYRKFNI